MHNAIDNDQTKSVSEHHDVIIKQNITSGKPLIIVSINITIIMGSNRCRLKIKLLVAT